MVTPEMGLLEEPTSPAMYPATAEKIKAAPIMQAAMVSETAVLLINTSYKINNGTTDESVNPSTHFMGISFSVRSTCCRPGEACL